MSDEKNFTEDSEISSRAAKDASPREATNEGTATEPGEVAGDLSAAYQKLLAEKQELYERLLRKQAEIENVRKRVEREKAEFLQHATTGLVRALLPTLDSLERGLKHREKSVPPKFYEGMELIHRELLEVLKRAGLEAIESEGNIFDPHLHQAVETVEAEGYQDQEIVEELQRGYRLRQRLLRPAIVRVAVAGSKDAGTSPGAGNSDDE